MSHCIRKIEEIREKVRHMPRGGDLDELLNREVGDFARWLRENLVRERSAASDEADFAPLRSARGAGASGCGAWGARMGGR